MELDLKWLLGTIGLVLGVLTTKLVDKWFADSNSERDELTKLTLAMTELKIEMRHLSEKLMAFGVVMPKIQQDLNELHGKVREINARKDY